MQLVEIVSNLASIDDELTIYAVEPWTCTSEAVLAHEPEAGGLPTSASAAQATYFIEVFIAKEFLEGWKANRRGHHSALDECERLIQYALNDA